MQCLKLQDVIASLESTCLHELPWASSAWCTPNFAGAVAGKAGDQYLRPVDNLLCFLSGEVLLVSEREAHCLLGALWQLGFDSSGQSSVQRHQRHQDGPPANSTSQNGHPVLMNLAYARCQHALSHPTPTLATCALSASVKLTQCQVASLKLFAGETQFQQDLCLQHVKPLVQQRPEAARVLTQLRGTQRSLPCSDLETLAKVRSMVWCGMQLWPVCVADAHLQSADPASRMSIDLRVTSAQRRY